MTFTPKAQIAYIPSHADGDIDHPDVEYGFVTSQRGEMVFCRFWWRGRPGDLRTRDNSEGTDARYLVIHKSVDDKVVDRVWKLANI